MYKISPKYITREANKNDKGKMPYYVAVKDFKMLKSAVKLSLGLQKNSLDFTKQGTGMKHTNFSGFFQGKIESGKLTGTHREPTKLPGQKLSICMESITCLTKVTYGEYSIL